MSVNYYPNYPFNANASNHYFSGYNNFTANFQSMYWNVTYPTPSYSGVFCAYYELFDDFSGSTLDSDEVCFTIVYDDDLDGVWNELDVCPSTLINLAVDANGCATYQLDSDLDGYNDAIDLFPYDGTQWSDSDGDGYGDNPQGNNADAFPNDSTQWSDNDGDGYGDNLNGTTPDSCPNIAGTSFWDLFGCTDYDGDGWSDTATLSLKMLHNGQMLMVMVMATILKEIMRMHLSTTLPNGQMLTVMVMATILKEIMRMLSLMI